MFLVLILTWHSHYKHNSNCRIIIFCSGSNDTISQQVKHYSKTMKDPSTDEDDDDYLKVVYVPDYSIP